MEHLFFFFRDKNRLKFFVFCAGIGLPLLLLAGFGINYYEDKQAAAGIPNEKGGLDYYYGESSGLEKLPELVAKFVSIYPESEVLYLNMSTDKSGKISGNFMSYTKDSFEKVVNYYKEREKLVDQDADNINFVDGIYLITISKEKERDDDFVKGQTKFDTSFNDYQLYMDRTDELKSKTDLQ